MIQGSKGESISYKLEKLSDENYNIEFKPSKVGKYRVDVEEGAGEVLNSPMFISVYDPSMVKIVSSPNKLIVASENSFESQKCFIFH